MFQKAHTRHPPLNRWAKKIRSIYHEAKAWDGPDEDVPAGQARQMRIEKQREFEKRLKAICLPYLTTDVPMNTLCGRIIKFLPEMFVFIRFPGVSPENNHAERMLRHTVISRKISGGTRSPKGSQTKAILTSLFDTWHLQNKNPLSQCQLMLASCQ